MPIVRSFEDNQAWFIERYFLHKRHDRSKNIALTQSNDKPGNRGICGKRGKCQKLELRIGDIVLLLISRHEYSQLSNVISILTRIKEEKPILLSPWLIQSRRLASIGMLTVATGGENILSLQSHKQHSNGSLTAWNQSGPMFKKKNTGPCKMLNWNSLSEIA